MAPGALAVGNKAETLDYHWVFAFEQFRRHRSVSTAHYHRRGAVDAVQIRPSAPSAKEHVHEREIFAAGLAIEMEHTSAFADAAERPRQCLRDCPEHRIAQRHHQRRAPADRRRESRIQNSSFWYYYLDWLDKTVVDDRVDGNNRLERCAHHRSGRD